MLQVPRRKIRKRKYPNEWKHKQRTIIPENFHNLNVFPKKPRLKIYLESQKKS
jgi:hypothetical protein